MNNKMEFIESCDVEKAKFIISLTQQEFEATFVREEKYYKTQLNPNAKKTEQVQINKDRAKEREIYYKNTIQHLRTLLLTWDKDTNTLCLSVKYKQSFKCKFRESQSRHYSCGASIQKMTRNMRNFVLADNAEELDIVSSHPSAAKYYARLYGIKCPNMDEYLEDKKAVMAKYGFTKDDFNKMMYKDKFDNNNQFLSDVHYDLSKIKKRIINEFGNFDEYAEWYKNNKPDKNNPISSYVGLKLEIIEYNVIEALLSMVDNEQVLFPLHDALMLKIGMTQKYDLIKNFELWKKENPLFDHFKIDIKSCKSNISISEDFETFNIPTTAFTMYIPERGELDEYILNNCDTVVRITEDSFMVFNPKKCIFEEQDKQFACHAVLNFVLIEYGLHTWFQDKKPFESTLNLLQNKYVKIASNMVKTKEPFQLFNQMRGTVPILGNKIYLNEADEKGNKIIDRVPAHKWTFEIPCNYLPDDEYDSSIGKEYFHGLFVPDLSLEQHKNKKPQDLDYEVVGVIVDYLYTIMMGYKLRYLLSITGVGRNGKSLFMELLDKILNSVSDKIAKNALIYRPNKDHKNEDVQCLEKNFLCVLDETDENDKIDSAAVKAYVDDIQDKKVTVRALHKDTKKMSIRANICVTSNYSLKVQNGTSETAVFDRYKSVKACNVREVNPSYGSKVLNENFDQIVNYIIRNGKIIGEIKDTPSMMKAKKECGEASNIIFKFLQSSENYEFVDESPEENNEGFGLTKFKKHLKSWGDYNDSTIKSEVNELLNSSNKLTHLLASMNIKSIKDQNGNPKRIKKEYIYSGLRYTQSSHIDE